MLGGEDGRLVAGDRALRRERVHRLGARHARDRVEREGGYSALGEGPGELRVVDRLQQGDQYLPFAQARDLLARRSAHLADDVRPRVELVLRDEPRSGLLVGGVGEGRRLAGSALDDDVHSVGDEPPRRVRHDGHPGFPGPGLLGDTHVHRARV